MNHTTFVSLNNQQCMNESALINIHPYEYNQGFCYYPFAVNWDRYIGICNTLIELSNKACAPNKPEELNISIFNKITEINKSKTWTKHISCKCKCRFDDRKYCSN